jgi:hypothetical protein
MSDEQIPQQPPFMPPPPPPAASPAAPEWSPATTVPTEAPQRRRRTGLVVGAVVAALVLIGGIVGLTAIGGESGSASAQPLALAFTPGQTETYTTHMTMDGEMDAGELLGGSQPIVMDVTQTVTWEVASVDADGVATVDVAVEEMTGTLNGMAIPDAASSTGPVEMQIAPDGRILSAGGMSFAGFDQTGGASFPGMGQMTPLLPDGPVQPGDTWTKDFSQDVPFGEGTIEFTSTSTLERYEDVDGVNAAVVTTEFTVPMDFTIDFGKILDAMGGTESMPTGPTGLADAQIAYGGSGQIRQTAWVDPDAKQMLKMTSSGSFDMTMAFTGLAIFEGQTIGFTGDFTQDLTRG